MSAPHLSDKSLATRYGLLHFLCYLPSLIIEYIKNRNMTAFGLEVVVVNSDTCAEARGANRDLWIETRNRGSIIVLSPEELQNPEFRRLIDHPDFCKRICKLGIDEIHLLHWWGKSFRPAFQQVGYLRPRLPSFRGSNISLIGTTATLRKGPISNRLAYLLCGYHKP